MTNTERGPTETANRIIESVRDSTEPALEAVRKFVDTVDGYFPHVSQDGPRRKIIDAAFKMTEQLVRAGTQAAEKIVSATGESLGQRKRATATKKAASATKARARASATAKKTATKRTSRTS
jgi:hypothetical protein